MLNLFIYRSIYIYILYKYKLMYVWMRLVVLVLLYQLGPDFEHVFLETWGSRV